MNDTTDWWASGRCLNFKRNIVVRPDHTGCIFTIFRLDEDVYKYSVHYMHTGKTVFSDRFHTVDKAEESAREYAEELRRLNV